MLTIAVSVWLLVMSPGGKTADCATAQQMWTYYQSQLVSARSAALKSEGDNDGNRGEVPDTCSTHLQAYANRVTTPDIRPRTDQIVSINRDMFEQWKTLGRAKSGRVTRPGNADIVG